jgi:hypothetical protein
VCFGAGFVFGAVELLVLVVGLLMFVAGLMMLVDACSCRSYCSCCSC